MPDEPTPPEEAPSEEPSDEDITKLIAELLSEEEPAEVGGEGTPPEPAQGSEGGSEGAPAETPPSTPPAEVKTPELDFSSVAADPQAQAFLREAFQHLWAQAKQAERGQAEAQEVQRLVEAGDHERLGEMFAERYRTQTQRQQAETEIVQSLAGEVFRKALVSGLIDGALTPEETAKLQQAPTAEDYFLGIAEIAASRKGAADIQTKLEEAVKERTQALENELKGLRAQAPSATGTPPGASGGSLATTGDLLADGLIEAFREKGLFEEE